MYKHQYAHINDNCDVEILCDEHVHEMTDEQIFEYCFKNGTSPPGIEVPDNVFDLLWNVVPSETQRKLFFEKNERHPRASPIRSSSSSSNNSNSNNKNHQSRVPHQSSLDEEAGNARRSQIADPVKFYEVLKTLHTLEPESALRLLEENKYDVMDVFHELKFNSRARAIIDPDLDFPGYSGWSPRYTPRSPEERGSGGTVYLSSVQQSLTDSAIDNEIAYLRLLKEKYYDVMDAFHGVDRDRDDWATGIIDPDTTDGSKNDNNNTCSPLALKKKWTGPFPGYSGWSPRYTPQSPEEPGFGGTVYLPSVQSLTNSAIDNVIAKPDSPLSPPRCMIPMGNNLSPDTKKKAMANVMIANKTKKRWIRLGLFCLVLAGLTAYRMFTLAQGSDAAGSVEDISSSNNNNATGYHEYGDEP